MYGLLKTLTNGNKRIWSKRRSKRYEKLRSVPFSASPSGDGEARSDDAVDRRAWFQCLFRLCFRAVEKRGDDDDDDDANIAADDDA